MTTKNRTAVNDYRWIGYAMSIAGIFHIIASLAIAWLAIRSPLDIGYSIAIVIGAVIFIDFGVGLYSSGRDISKDDATF